MSISLASVNVNFFIKLYFFAVSFDLITVLCILSVLAIITWSAMKMWKYYHIIIFPEWTERMMLLPEVKCSRIKIVSHLDLWVRTAEHLEMTVY